MKIACSKHHLKKIGQKIRRGDRLTNEDEVCFAAFRKGHEKILTNFRSRMNDWLSKKEYRSIRFVQRLKKRDTIVNKLKDRLKEMDLLRMQDIAGGRLFFKDIPTLLKFRNQFIHSKEKRYRRINNDDKFNYIKKPADSGYRGIHDVYEEITDDSVKAKIEIQYRTYVQHSWATALEVWDSNYGGKTKFGQDASPITMFFKLISELFSRELENKINLTISDLELFQHIIKLDNKLHIIKKLKKVKPLQLELPLDIDLKYIVLQKQFINNFKVDLKIPEVTNVIPKEYFELERLHFNDDLVLVKSQRNFLERAYNNYFNDATPFLNNLEESIHQLRRKYPFKSRWYAFKYNWNYLK